MAKKKGGKKAARSVVEAIREGLESKKCRRCKTMAQAMSLAEVVLAASPKPKVAAFAAEVGALRAQGDGVPHKDLGCSGCSGSKVEKKIKKSFALPRLD